MSVFHVFKIVHMVLIAQRTTFEEHFQVKFEKKKKKKKILVTQKKIHIYVYKNKKNLKTKS